MYKIDALSLYKMLSELAERWEDSGCFGFDEPPRIEDYYFESSAGFIEAIDALDIKYFNQTAVDNTVAQTWLDCMKKGDYSFVDEDKW